MNNKTKYKQRDTSLDACAGLMILYVVFFHAATETPAERSVLNCIVGSILHLFMFWFFFKAGIFYRHRSFRQCVENGWKRLLKPYLFWLALGHVLWCVQLLIMKENDWVKYLGSPIKQILLTGSSHGDGPVWFLLTMFLVRCLYSVVYDKIHPIAITIVCFAVSFTLNYFGIGIPKYLPNTFLGLGFFASGNMLRKIQYNNIMFAFGTITYITIIILFPSVVSMFGNTLVRGCYPLAIIGSLGGIIFFNNVFRLLPIRFKWLVSAGRDSMSYFVMHYIVLCIVSTLWTVYATNSNTWLLFTFELTACIIILPPLNYYLKKSKIKWTLGL